LAVLIGRPAMAAARCASSDACLREIEAARRATQSISADFEQVKHVSLLDEPLVSRGRLTFKRPNRLRVEIASPQPATVVINDGRVFIPDLPEQQRQALTLAPAGDAFAHLGALFTGSTDVLQEAFETTAVADGDAIAVTLVPRHEPSRRMFKAIAVRFAFPDLMAQTIRLDDPFGDSLEITLRNVQRNDDVPDSLFEDRRR
jgi:outer membrane lipoprotein-sorting protein